MAKLLKNLLVLGAMVSVAPVAAHQRPATSDHQAAMAHRHDGASCPYARAKAAEAARKKAVAIAIMRSNASGPAEGSFLEFRSEAPGLVP